jgi:hypothetical protein
MSELSNIPPSSRKYPDVDSRMLTPEFLRRQADNCLRISRSCFDLASAERLRLMAMELTTKAAEMDNNDRFMCPEAASHVLSSRDDDSE